MILIFLLLLCVPLASAQSSHVADVFEPGGVSEFPVSASPGERVVFEAEGPDAVAKPPILVLWSKSTGRMVSSNSGLSPRLEFVGPVPAETILVVLPSSNANRGACAIRRNGQPWQATAEYRGRYAFSTPIQPGETAVAVRRPGSPTHRMYMMQPPLGSLSARGDHSLMNSLKPAPLGHVIIAATSISAGKSVRVYRNDAALPGRDPDSDGLGAELEQELQTCSKREDVFGNFRCSTVKDLRDTDGDGISDGWEVLGREWKGSNGETRYVQLPFMGANPRHKDLFAELDFFRRTQEENIQKVTVKFGVGRDKEEDARYFAAAYGDAQTTDPRRAAVHALTYVKNPDGLPGIAAHLDTGVASHDPKDQAIFGDWGGFNAVDAEFKDGSWRKIPYLGAWKVHMHPSRYGIFRHFPIDSDCAGQTQMNSFEAMLGHCAYTAIHESAHANGISHNGPFPGQPDAPICMPNYPSILSYGWKEKLANVYGYFSDGDQAWSPLNHSRLKERRAVRPTNVAQLEYLSEYFGYVVDFATGDVDWNRDGRIAPEGSTVRAYPDSGNCEGTRIGESELRRDQDSGPVALAQVGKHVAILTITKSRAAQLYIVGKGWRPPFQGTVDPPNPNPPFLQNLVGIDATPCGEGRLNLCVVAIDQKGDIHMRRGKAIDFPNWPFLWQGSAAKFGGNAAGEPSLARAPSGVLHLVYKKPDGRLVRRTSSGPDSPWTEESPVRDSAGVNLKTCANASPEIGFASLPATGGWSQALWGAFADSSCELHLYSYNFNSDRWDASNLIKGKRPTIVGRPSLTWLPQADIDIGGRLYLAYTRSTDRFLRWMFTHSVNGTLELGRDGFFDNQWFDAAGFSFIASDEGTPRLKGVVNHLYRGTNNTALRYRPFADGITDVTYRNLNDWPTLAWSICARVVNPGNMVSNPIGCPDKPDPMANLSSFEPESTSCADLDKLITTYSALHQRLVSQSEFDQNTAKKFRMAIGDLTRVRTQQRCP